jgi:uncharacterized oxidoreductase
MKTSNNTILITGGSAGIGFEMAKLLSENNTVIITGRNKERLDAAAAKLKNTTAIVGDISKDEDADALLAHLQKDFPQLNVVINNAGAAYYYKLDEPGVSAWQKAADEMQTNYISIIRLNEKLLPIFAKQADAAIVNVTSIVAFTPNAGLTTYGASKAALHAYTQALRHTLRETSIKVFELMPPLVDTEFSAEIGGAQNGIPPLQVAEEFMTAFATDDYEIRVGRTAEFHKAYFANSVEGFQAMNNRGE